MTRIRLAVFTSLAVALLGHPTPAAEFDNPLSHTGWVSGTSPSGLNWTAVATGTALPIRSSGTQNGMTGAVAYFNTRNGQVQIDPKGWNLALFNLTYTTGGTNPPPTNPGPLFYATGTSPTSSVVSGSTGLANQKTLPAGTWTLITASPSRIAGTVSLVRSPTLATSYDAGNGAANGTSPYSTDPSGTPSTPGWFNQPWAFPADMVQSGSVASMSMSNWKTFGVTGNANANVLGFGNYQSTFQYSVDGVVGNQVGAFVPYVSAASLTWNTTSGTWSTSSTDWTGNASTFVNGDTVTFDSSAGGTVTLSGTLQPGAFSVSATAGTYTFSGGAGNLIAGSTSLAKSGAGVAVFTSANSWSGGTNLTGGTLRAGTDGALGTGTLSLSGGTIASADSSARAFTNAVAVGGDVTVGDGTGTGAVTFSGATNLGAATRAITTVADTTLSGVISNGGLTKLGGGTLVLTAANTYAGATTVSAGKLVVNGSLANSTVTVGSGGALGGSGTIGSLVTVQAGGTLTPGNNPGLLSVGSLDLQPNSTTIMQIIGAGSGAGTAGSDYDKVLITTASGLGYGGTLDLDFANSVAFADGTTFDLFGFTGSTVGHFGSVGSTGSGSYGGLTFSGVGGVWTALFGSQLLTFSELTGQLRFTNSAPVPEIDPNSLGSAFALLAGSLGLLERRVRSRKRG